MNPLYQLKSVLCDPEGKCCISGSDEDRAIIDLALKALAEPAPEPINFDAAFNAVNWDEWRHQPVRELVRELHRVTAPVREPAPVQEPVAVKSVFQNRVQPWMIACFGEVISGDKTERNHRFLEESLELVQACGCTQSEAHQLVDYVYGRDVGEKPQEVGGVMVTLAALCLAQDLDMHECGEVELARIWKKVEQIRAKQAAKPKHSPLPAPVQEPENHFKSACWLRTSFSIGRYLMSNAHGRWNGTEKALYHRELCKFYVAAVRGFDDEGLVDLCGEDFKAVHKSTQQLTDRMDEVIGFPLDSAPDYAKLEPLFFEHFHTLATQALQVSQQPAPPADVPMLTDDEILNAYCANPSERQYVTVFCAGAKWAEKTLRQKAGLK